jgi:hypothetical protein
MSSNRQSERFIAMNAARQGVLFSLFSLPRV